MLLAFIANNMVFIFLIDVMREKIRFRVVNDCERMGGQPCTNMSIHLRKLGQF